MRWIPLIALAGCVPISADEYAGGRSSLDSGVDSSIDQATAHDDAGMDAQLLPTLDAAGDTSVVVAPPDYVDAGGAPQDAGLDAQVDDAGKDAASEPVVIDCTTQYVVCEDFESGPKCPSMPGVHWSECEHIGDATGPQREELLGGSFALRARITADAGARSQRVLRRVPTDADYFEAQFDMITDPTDNASFVWMKLQQEVGMNANGEPINYPGVSLTGSNGKMAVVVETQRTLSTTNGSDVKESALGPWPQGWIHVMVQIDFKKPSVHVEYYDPLTPWDYASYTASKIVASRQYFALGLYSESPGAVQMLFDNVMFYAKKDGKLIALP